MLEIRETYTNETKGHQFGQTEWYEPWTDDLGRLFRSLQREYGRCMSKVYADPVKPQSERAPLPHTPLAERPEYGPPVQTGWYFEKRMRYEDARGNDPERDYYTRGVWVQYRHTDSEPTS